MKNTNIQYYTNKYFVIGILIILFNRNNFFIYYDTNWYVSS